MKYQDFTVEADEDEQEYSVVKGNLFVSIYPYDSSALYSREEAKAAAQAECDRLNEEIQKGAEMTYDPCRPFRKGDIVEPCSVNGRWSSHVWEARSSIHYEVAEAEDPLTAHMELKDPDSSYTFLVHAAFFKLIMPVEELEPYRVGTGIDSQLLYCNSELFAEFEKEEEAKRVCDLLNSEHRKEQQQ